MARRFISMAELVCRIGLSKSQVYRLINEGSFPKPVPLGPQKIAFLDSEVEAWITQRLRARDAREGEATRREKARASVQHTRRCRIHG